MQVLKIIISGVVFLSFCIFMKTMHAVWYVRNLANGILFNQWIGQYFKNLSHVKFEFTKGLINLQDAYLVF